MTFYGVIVFYKTGLPYVSNALYNTAKKAVALGEYLTKDTENTFEVLSFLYIKNFGEEK